ncbi:DUF4214 domain-containing protein [Pseudoduganella sp. OTU4001]|uniref:DUF4214 domain-containing protein n=1 Tax=Pseudoduganella sp. OTU4001 TaxID=3043854 RepID=UPI00313D4F4C
MSYPKLSQIQMDSAPQLDLTTYGLAGYESVALYFAEFPIGAAEAIFSWQAMAGAVYTLQSSSYNDPGVLLVYDQAGNAIFEDDGTGIPGSDHATFFAPYSGTFYVFPAWRQGSGEGQHGVTLSVYEDVTPAAAPVISGSALGEVLNGTAGAENILGAAGNDSLRGRGGDDYLDGGPGLDMAFFASPRAAYEVRAYGDRFLMTDFSGNDGRDLLSNVERLVFPDMSLAIDVDGGGGKAFRIYQAAFDRTPDMVGLGFWIYQIDHGLSLEAIAGGFIDSAEFRSIYGNSPSNFDVVYRFYQNVLHREPDAGGLEFWVHVLDAGLATRAQVLIGFSESPENYLQLIGSMSDGVPYTPWG